MLRLDTVDVSESQPCGAPRGFRRQTTSLVRVLKQRQVRVDLTGQIAIGLPNAEQVQQAFEETAHGQPSYPSPSSSSLTSADSTRPGQGRVQCPADSRRAASRQQWPLKWKDDGHSTGKSSGAWSDEADGVTVRIPDDEVTTAPCLLLELLLERHASRHVGGVERLD